MVQLAQWVVAGQIIMGNKDLPSADMHSIAGSSDISMLLNSS